MIINTIIQMALIRNALFSISYNLIFFKLMLKTAINFYDKFSIKLDTENLVIWLTTNGLKNS